jgi:hypothetical protein
MKSTDPRNCWIKSAMPSASNTVPSTDLEDAQCRNSVVGLLDVVVS